MRDNVSMQGLSAATTLRPRTSRVLAVCLCAIAAITLVSLVVARDGGDLIVAAAPLAMLAVVGWTVFWRPSVQVGPDGLVFVNPLRTIEAPWSAVQDVETRWVLAIVTASSTLSAWAAPRPTRAASGFGMRRDQWGRPDFAEEQRHERAMPSATGDVAAYLVRRQWEQYTADNPAPVEHGGVTVRWHRATIAVLVVLAVLWVLAAVLRARH